MKTKINKSLISINALHSEIEESIRTSILKAIQVGEHLSNVKKQLPHGEFTGWIKDNLSFTDRMARNYMRLFANKDKLKGADVNISEGIKLLQATTIKTNIDSFSAALQAGDRLIEKYMNIGQLIRETPWREGIDATVLYPALCSHSRREEQESNDMVENFFKDVGVLLDKSALDYRTLARLEQQVIELQNKFIRVQVEMRIAEYEIDVREKRQSISVLKQPDKGGIEAIKP